MEHRHRKTQSSSIRQTLSKWLKRSLTSTKKRFHIIDGIFYHQAIDKENIDLKNSGLDHILPVVHSLSPRMRPDITSLSDHGPKPLEFLLLTRRSAAFTIDGSWAFFNKTFFLFSLLTHTKSRQFPCTDLLMIFFSSFLQIVHLLPSLWSHFSTQDPCRITKSVLASVTFSENCIRWVSHTQLAVIHPANI